MTEEGKAFELVGYKEAFNLETVGPYSAMAKIKPGATLLFLSGLCARDTMTGKVPHIGDVGAQTTNIMERIKTALEQTGASMKDIFYLHVYLAEEVDQAQKQEFVDPAFGKFFEGHLPPCNVVMGIKKCYMPRGDSLIEIEAWAAVNES